MGSETLQICRYHTDLAGKITPVQNDARFKKHAKTFLSSEALLGAELPCKRITLQAENASQYSKQLYESLCEVLFQMFMPFYDSYAF